LKQLIFIGREFHKRTGSANFLIELLDDFEVTFCYIDEYGDNPYGPLEAFKLRKFELLVCWQVMPSRELLDRSVQFKQGAFFPMYDDCPQVKKVEKWWPYRDFNIICFSKKNQCDLVKSGFSAKYIQYFPKPAENPMPGDSASAFFWFRRENIGMELVKKLFSKTELKNLHIHNAPDPGNIFKSSDASGPIHCIFSTWYEDKRDMVHDIEKCAFYVAPREQEGIGMAFLEAMALGKCVVAPDAPTMNEYIEHGRTGLLYSMGKVKPLQDIDLRKIQNETYRYMTEGYEKWLSDRELISNWLIEPVRISKRKMRFALLRRFFRNPIKVCRLCQ
jgi:hypothetical protein